MVHRNMLVLVQAYLVGSSLLANVTATSSPCNGESCNSQEEDPNSLLQSFRKQSASEEWGECQGKQCGDSCYMSAYGSYGACGMDGICHASPTRDDCRPRKQSCRGDSEAWESQFGRCSTYGAGGSNHKYCTSDKDKHGSGLTASAACPECGTCESSTTTTTTAKVCKGDPTTWNAGYGACHTYAPEKQNFNHCSGDQSGGLFASDVCPQCGNCTEVPNCAPLGEDPGNWKFGREGKCCGDANAVYCEYGRRCGYCPQCARTLEDVYHPKFKKPHRPAFCCDMSEPLNCDGKIICGRCPTTTTTTTTCASWGDSPVGTQCCGHAPLQQCSYGPRCGYCPPCANTLEDVWSPKWKKRPAPCCDGTKPLNCDGKIICGKCPSTTTTTTTEPTYIRVKKGTCESPYTFISNKTQCETAATDLGLKDTEVGTEKAAASDDAADFPQGCYYIPSNSDWNRRLYFRKQGSSSTTSESRQPICVLLA